MIVDTDVVDSTPIARLRGEIDMSNVGDVEEQINAAVTNKAFALIVDLSDVTYLDSAGIRMLFQLEMRVTNRQQRLFLVVPRDLEINRTLEASGAIGSLRIALSEKRAEEFRTVRPATSRVPSRRGCGAAAPGPR